MSKLEEIENNYLREVIKAMKERHDELITDHIAFLKEMVKAYKEKHYHTTNDEYIKFIEDRVKLLARKEVI